MTFTAYIQRQKSLIRSRREGDRPAFMREQIVPDCDTQSLLNELISLKGLNTAERQRYSKVKLLAGKQ